MICVKSSKIDKILKTLTLNDKKKVNLNEQKKKQ